MYVVDCFGHYEYLSIKWICGFERKFNKIFSYQSVYYFIPINAFRCNNYCISK